MKKRITCIAFLLVFILSLGAFACAQKPANYIFVCPDGAPALATYSVMDMDGIDFTVYDNGQAVDSISVDMASGKADFAILPINLATKMAKHGYKTLGVLTHGNLYGVSRVSISGLDDLKGKKVGVIQLGAIPGFTVKLMLESAGIEYTQDINALDSNNVFLRAIDAKPDVVKSLLDYPENVSEENKLDVCIVAEPMCNTIVNKFSFIRCLSIQDEYGTFPQAVLMVKNSVLQNDSSVVQSIVNKMQNFDFTAISAQNAVDTISANFFNASSGAKSSLNPAALSVVALQKSNIYFEKASEHKTEITSYINALKKFNTEIGKIVEDITDDFFA